MIKPDRVIALRGDRTVVQYGNRCAKVYSRARSCVDVLQEARNLAAAREAGASAPRFIEVSCLDGCWALVTEYVPGETLAQRVASDGLSLEDGLRTLTEAQTAIHAADASRFPGLKEALWRRVQYAPLGGSVKEGLLYRLDGLEDGGMLCHGDLSPQNLLLPAGLRPVAVDWKRACRGSGDADAAATWLALELEYGRDAAQDYLRQYSRACDSPEGDILRWLPVVAASRLAGSVRRERDALLRVIGETTKGGYEL